jgi:hypothetical protein
MNSGGSTGSIEESAVTEVTDPLYLFPREPNVGGRVAARVHEPYGENRARDHRCNSNWTV